MKPLLIGLAPGRIGDGEPLAGLCGRRLADLCDLDLDAYLARFDRINLYPCQIDRLYLSEARRMADRLAERVAAREIAVFLGSDVGRAFLVRSPFFQWTKLSRDCGDVVVAPHPSGRNRWWNNPANVRRARMFWRNLAK
jgi:hypothetical protein